MKKLSVLFALTFILSSLTFSQILVEEEFDYTVGTTLTANGYTAHSGAGTNSITVISGNLTYPGYPSQGTGGMIQMVNTGEDVHKTLASDVTSGTVYASMLVSVDSARTGDYFFHFGPNPISTTFRCRTFIKLAANGNLAFGLSVGTTGTSVFPTYTDSIYTTGTTYLVVVAYQIVDGATNDVVKLWVNPVLTGIEPTPLVTLTDATQSDINVGSYAYRQGTAASASFLKIDGLRIFTQWDAVLPVELTSFTASVSNRNVNLNWSTATEINNSGFEVERKSENSNWQTVGFIKGNGTTTSTHAYSFTDKNLSEGKYSYRLKQIDFNGAFEYSNVIEAEISSSVKEFSLNQNYPNPFNPSTSIQYAIGSRQFVTLKVYNLLGKEVASLVNETKEAGSYSLNFDASDLPSGIYIYKLQAGNFTQTRKMTLMK